MADTEIELFKLSYDSRQKYVYFLLAAVGACIGFTVTQTREAQITPAMIPLGIAIACWALSFYFGCRHLQKKIITVDENIHLNQLKAGNHPAADGDPESTAMGLQVIGKDFETNQVQAIFAYRWQFRWFMVASIAFLLWHVSEMWQRTSII